MKTSTHFSILALVVGCFLFAVPSLQATHIVGGDLTYRIISKTDTKITVELTLSVYRDCLNGADDAPFDDPAHIGIFDRNNKLIRDFTIPYSGVDDTLTDQLQDSCLVNLTPVCVHRTSYVGTVELDIIPGGYTFAYQRCCRNVTLQNIINPLQTGATFLVRLRETAIAAANSSPVFKNWPPVYICDKKPFVFDHGAVDTLNDENNTLIYSLCTPFSGGTLNDPQPIPTDPPPYDQVVWAPGYGLDSMLGPNLGDNTLKIDPNTGEMTVTPNGTGQFVVGVCVVELAENGDTLSIIRRDFQYNVNPCGDRTAAIVAPEVQCDDLTVTFENASENATTYKWEFPGAVSGQTSTSNAPTLSRTYPDTGTYTVTLIADPNTLCSDTTTHTFRLVNNSLAADFVAATFECGDSVLLNLVDASVDSIVGIDAYEWTVAYNGTTQTFTTQNVQVNIPLNVTGTITLRVTSENNCEATKTAPFDTMLDNPGELIENNLTACAGEAFFLNPNTPDSIAFNYQWAPAGPLIDPADAVNPRAIITEPTVFTVTITPSEGVCEIIETVTVSIGTEPVPAFDAVVGCDGLTVAFANNSTDAVSYLWDFGTEQSTETSPSFQFPGLGEYAVKLIATSADGCQDSLVQTIVLEDVSLLPAFGFEYIDCGPDGVTFQLIDQTQNAANNTANYLWELSTGQTSTEQNPTFTVGGSGTIDVTLTVTTADNCSATATGEVTVGVQPPTDQFPDQVAVCLGDSYTFTPGGNPNFNYVWTPDSEIDDVNSPAPTITPTQNRTYTVLVGTDNLDICAVTETVEVIVIDPAVTSLSFTVVENCDGATFQFTNTSTGTAGYRWDFGDGNTSTEVNPTYTYETPGTYTVTLASIYDVDCIAPATEEVEATEGTVTAAFSATIPDCTNGSATVQFADASTNSFNNGLTYDWTFVNGTPVTSSEQNPLVTVTTAGDLIATLTVTSGNGCEVSTTDTIAVTFIELSLADTLYLCPGEEVSLNPGGDPDLIYSWSPAAGLSSTTVANPTAAPTQTTTYIATVSTANATGPVCTITDSVTVVVEDGLGDFTVSLEPDGSSVQSGETVTTCEATIGLTTGLAGVTGVPVTWTNTAGQTVGTGPSIDYTVAGTDTLTVMATGPAPANCPANATIVVVDASVELNLPNEQPFCPGDTVVLNPGGNPDWTYVWTPATGLSDPTAPSPVATPLVTTTYTAVVTNTINGVTCTATAMTTVSVPDDIEDFAIAIDVTSSETVIGPDGVVTTCAAELELNAGLSADAAVTWTDAAGNPLGTGNTITINTLAQDTVIATLTPQDCPNPVADTLVIAPNVVSVELMDEQFLCPDSSAQLNPGGNPDWTYVWTPATGLDDPTSANPTATPSVTTTYTVVVSNELNGLTCTATDMTTVTVAPALAGFEISLETTGGANGGSVVGPDGTVTTCEPELDLTAGISVGSTAEVTWTTPAGDTLGMGRTLTLSTPGQDTIIATATDPVTNCSSADTLIIAPNIVSLDVPSDATICPDEESAQLNPGGNPEWTYEWTPATGLDDPTAPSPVASPTETTTYTVTASNELNGLTCTDEGMVTVTVVPPLGLDIGNDGPGQGDPILTCGEDVTLSGNLPPGAGPATITWTSAELGDLGQSETITVNPFQTDTIYATATFGPNGACMEMDTVVIIDNGVDVEVPGPVQTCQGRDTLLTVMNLDDSDALTYLWAPVEAIVGSFTEMSATIRLPESGSFEVSVTVANQKNCDTTIVIPVTVEEFNPPGLPSEMVEVCAGEPTGINPGGNASLDWVWTPMTGLDLSDPFNPVVTTDEDITYTYTASDPETGCSVDGQVMVDVQAPPSLTTDDEVVDCEGSVDLTATTDAGAGLAWYDNPTGSGNPLGMGSPLTVTPTPGPTTYYVIATNAAGCETLDSVTVNSNPLNAMLTPPQVFCEPTESTEIVLSGLTAGQDYDIQWSTAELTGEGGTVGLQLGTNEYSVTVTNDLGCEQVLSTTVDVIDLSGLTGRADPPEINLGETSELTVTGCDDCGYEWFPPTGTVTPPDAAMVTADPDEAGDWIYEVEVTQLGCSSIVEIPLSVTIVDCIPERVYLPNAFTPNGDNNNDVLQLRASFLEEIIDMELIIYDRWGEQVFRTTDPSQGWDGTFQGAIVGPDVYGYWLRVVCPNEEELIQKGNITVIR